MDVSVVARPIDFFRFKADLIGQGDEGVVVDGEGDGGAEIGAGEISEFDWSRGRRRGWEGVEGEAVDEPFVVCVRAGRGVCAVEEVRGAVDAEDFGRVGDGLGEHETVSRWRVGGGVDGEEVY